MCSLVRFCCVKYGKTETSLKNTSFCIKLYFLVLIAKKKKNKKKTGPKKFVEIVAEDDIEIIFRIMDLKMGFTELLFEKKLGKGVYI